jgi:hypothetical protein
MAAEGNPSSPPSNEQGLDGVAAWYERGAVEFIWERDHQLSERIPMRSAYRRQRAGIRETTKRIDPSIKVCTLDR